MIDRIILKNFQAHKDTEIEFDKGVNVITGESDAGKSSVIRAMKWVAMNRPSGDRMKRHGTKVTKVVLNDVEKVRSNTKHYYKQDGVMHSSLQGKVPELVTTVLDLRPLNFQEQHDPYFLISDNPGQRAKTLNDVTDLTVIDSSLTEVKRQIRVLGVMKKENENNIEKLNTQIDELSIVREADKLLTKYEEGKDVEFSLLADLTETEALASRFKEAEFNLEQIPDPEDDISHLIQGIVECTYDDTVEVLHDNYIDAQHNLPDPTQDITVLADQLKELEILAARLAEIQELSDKVDAARKEFSRFPVHIPDLTPVIEKHVKLKVECEELYDLTFDFTVLSDEVGSFKRAIASYEQDLEDLKTKLGVCPLCERSF